jgi:hypothetical protein
VALVAWQILSATNTSSEKSSRSPQQPIVTASTASFTGFPPTKESKETRSEQAGQRNDRMERDGGQTRKSYGRSTDATAAIPGFLRRRRYRSCPVRPVMDGNMALTLSKSLCNDQPSQDNCYALWRPSARQAICDYVANLQMEVCKHASTVSPAP